MKKALIAAIGFAALSTLALVLYRYEVWTASRVSVPPDAEAVPSPRAGFSFTPLEQSRALPELHFVDADGRALSIDRKGRPVVKAFYHELGLEALRIYIDQSGKASRDLNILGIPTTLLIDRKGREIGRTVGPAEWDSGEVVNVIRRYLEKPIAARHGSPDSGVGFDDLKDDPLTARRFTAVRELRLPTLTNPRETNG